MGNHMEKDDESMETRGTWGNGKEHDNFHFMKVKGWGQRNTPHHRPPTLHALRLSLGC